MKPFPCLVGLVLRRRVLRAAGCAALCAVLGTGAFAQDTSTRSDSNRGDSDRRRPGSQDDGRGRGSFSPQEMQGRMLAAVRERFGVTNDEEWTIISERIGKVMEARRTAAGGSFFGFRGPGGGPGGPGGPGGSFGGRGDGNRDGGRGDGGRGDGGGFRGPRPGGSAETEALQSAVVDKLPEAELKARMAKLRETRKANEKKLEQAQEELRAVLTVRQEAIAVLMGLLQ